MDLYCPHHTYPNINYNRVYNKFILNFLKYLKVK